MAFLIIAGITVPVAIVGAKKTWEIGGSNSRAFSGGLRSTVRWTKRGWQVTTTPLLEADASAIETAVVGGDFVTVSGDMTGTLTCQVTVGDAPFVKVSTVAGGFRRVLVLTIRVV